uniref:F-box domain-containing protein n=1 Tax=Syphacia muris TaxID=451379 RepID=A0A0N5AYK0_9BILA
MANELSEAVLTVEACINDILCNLEVWKNLKEQLDCVEQMPSSSALVRCSKQWKSKLIARLQTEINETYQHGVSEKLHSLSCTFDTITNCKRQMENSNEPLPSFTVLSDIDLVLQYIREDVLEKWLLQDNYLPDKHVPMLQKPCCVVQHAIQRLKYLPTDV